MYAIAEVVKDTQSIKVGTEPMYMGDIFETVTNIKLTFPYKRRHRLHSDALAALDRVQRKGIFMIVKIN